MVAVRHFRRTTMMLGNGTTRKYQFDNRGQLTTQIEYSGATPFCTIVDGYDPVGNRLTRNLDGNPITWTYDDRYRLTGQHRAGQVCTHDAADKITTMIEGANLTTYTWTGFGTLASEITGNSTTDYAYSGQDQLIAVTDPSGAKTTYSFDGDGLRRSTLYEDQSQDPPVEMRTTFVWDGSDYLLLNGPSSNTVVLTLDGEIVSAGSFDLLPDSLGSVIGDIRSGQDPRVIFDYWPYGTLADAAVKPSFPFLFVGSLGYYRDSATLDYVRSRELNKAMGIWLQVDRLWPEERAYGYARSPVVNCDPLGLAPGPGGPGTNFGPCAIYYCEEHEFPHWSVHWITTHAFICVRGPNGGCSGGLYQKDGNICGPGKIENGNEQCPKNHNPNTTCRLLFTSCALASRVCECIRKAAQSPPFYIAPINCCYQFPTRMLDCACKGATFGKDKELAKVCLEHMINTMPLIKA